MQTSAKDIENLFVITLLKKKLKIHRFKKTHVNTKRRSDCHQDSKQDVGKEPKKWIEVNHLSLSWKCKKLQIANGMGGIG